MKRLFSAPGCSRFYVTKWPRAAEADLFCGGRQRLGEGLMEDAGAHERRKRQASCSPEFAENFPSGWPLPLRRQRSSGSPHRARMAQGQSSKGPLRPKITASRSAVIIRELTEGQLQ